jgi:ribosomal-protein-alanine N-acetyltransferase
MPIARNRKTKPPVLPSLRGPRVVLRLPDEKDAVRIAHYMEENRLHLARTNPPRGAEYYTATYWRKIAPAIARDFLEDRGARFFLFTLSGLPIGMAHFAQIIRGPFHACYLGYELAEREQGQGLMTEALRLGIDYLFQVRNLHRIMANHLPENQRSQRVLEKLGFVREGLARQYLFIDGQWRDHILTSLTNPSWREPEEFRQ